MEPGGGHVKYTLSRSNGPDVAWQLIRTCVCRVCIHFMCLFICTQHLPWIQENWDVHEGEFGSHSLLPTQSQVLHVCLCVSTF